VLLGYVIGGGESWRLSEADVLHIAVWATVAAHMVEAGGGPNAFLVYVACSIPLKSVATTAWSIAIKTLFTKRVPAADTGAALGLLDVLNSACGVAAPVLGGVTPGFGRIILSLVRFVPEPLRGSLPLISGVAMRLNGRPI
jgi:hypothetical protein